MIYAELQACIVSDGLLSPRRESRQSAVKGTPLDNPDLRGLPNRLAFLSTGTPLKKRSLICPARPLLHRSLTHSAFALERLVQFCFAPKFAAHLVSGNYLQVW